MSDLYLRTTVRPETERTALKQVCKIAGSAAALVFCSELILPLLEFEALGMWAWILGGSAAGLGIIPYLTVKQHKVHPEILQINREKMSLVADKKALFSISWNAIEAFNFLDNSRDYGLAFTLKPHVMQELAIHSKKTGLPEELILKSRKEYGVDLFLPFFSHGSYLMLEAWYDQNLRDISD